MGPVAETGCVSFRLDDSEARAVDRINLGGGPTASELLRSFGMPCHPEGTFSKVTAHNSL